MALAIAGPAAAAQLAGSEWRPTELDGIDVPSGSEIFVRFGGKNKIEGHGGCNRFLGAYKLAGSNIAIGPLATTRMACPEPIMEREARFLRALENSRQFMRNRIDLSLTDNAGMIIARLLQTDAD